MRNLAGHKQSTEIIKSELERVGIVVRRSDNPIGEPKSMVYGKLNGFTFERAWYYYVVEGLVPLDIANELYRTKVGKSDIRVAGHCACPPPGEWSKPVNLKTGRQIIDRGVHGCFLAWHEPGEIFNKDNEPVEEAIQRSLDRMNWEFGEIKNFPQFINSYHIDSELGLYLFVQAIKNL